MPKQISDRALEDYYRMGFKYSYGYDPLEPEQTYDPDVEPLDPEWNGWVKESEREE